MIGIQQYYYSILLILLLFSCHTSDTFFSINHYPKILETKVQNQGKALIFDFNPNLCFKDEPKLQALLLNPSYQALLNIDEEDLKSVEQINAIAQLSAQKHRFSLKVKLLSLAQKLMMQHQDDLQKSLVESSMSEKTASLKLLWEKLVFDQIDHLKKAWFKKIPNLFLVSAWQSDLDEHHKDPILSLLLRWTMAVRDDYLPIDHQVQWLYSNQKQDPKIQQANLDRFQALLDQQQHIRFDANHCDWVKAFLKHKTVKSASHDWQKIDSFLGFKIAAIDPSKDLWTKAQHTHIQSCRKRFSLSENQQAWNWVIILDDQGSSFKVFPFYHLGIPHLWDQSGGELFGLWAHKTSLEECAMSFDRSQLSDYAVDEIDWFSTQPQVDRSKSLNWRAKILGQHTPLKDQIYLIPDFFELLELESSSSLSWDFKGILNEIFMDSAHTWPVFQISSFELPLYSEKGELLAMGWMNFFQYAPYLFLFQETQDQAFELLGENLLQLRSPYLLVFAKSNQYPEFLWKYQSVHDGFLPLNQPLFFDQQKRIYLDMKQRGEALKNQGNIGKQPWKTMTLVPKYFWDVINSDRLNPLAQSWADQRLVVKDKLSKIRQFDLFKGLIILNHLEKISIDMGIFGTINIQMIDRHQNSQNK